MNENDTNTKPVEGETAQATRRATVCYLPDFLICPGCLTIQEDPYVEGDECICGCRFIDGKAVREWKRIFDLVGSVVAEARLHQARGGHHLAVYGAIGKVLISRDEFDSHFERLVTGSRGGMDVSPCMDCGEPIECVPDGMPMCPACAEKNR